MLSKRRTEIVTKVIIVQDKYHYYITLVSVVLLITKNYVLLQILPTAITTYSIRYYLLLSTDSKECLALWGYVTGFNK